MGSCCKFGLGRKKSFYNVQQQNEHAYPASGGVYRFSRSPEEMEGWDRQNNGLSNGSLKKEYELRAREDAVDGIKAEADRESHSSSRRGSSPSDVGHSIHSDVTAPIESRVLERKDSTHSHDSSHSRHSDGVGIPDTVVQRRESFHSNHSTPSHDGEVVQRRESFHSNHSTPSRHSEQAAEAVITDRRDSIHSRESSHSRHSDIHEIQVTETVVVETEGDYTTEVTRTEVTKVVDDDGMVVEETTREVTTAHLTEEEGLARGLDDQDESDHDKESEHGFHAEGAETITTTTTTIISVTDEDHSEEKTEERRMSISSRSSSKSSTGEPQTYALTEPEAPVEMDDVEIRYHDDPEATIDHAFTTDVQEKEYDTAAMF